MKNKVQEIIKWWNKFNNMNIKISGIKKEFYLSLSKQILPHLLGLHYINSNKESLKGIRLYNHIKKNRISDRELYSLIQKHNPDYLDNVRDRITNFKAFMENLEKGRIVEMTNSNTRIKSNYLIVQTEDNYIMQLGVKDIGYEDVFETFFIRQDNDYFKNTSLNEPIISIQRYNENGELEKFSFKETPEIEKNIKPTIKENLENKTEDSPKRSSLLNRLSNKKNELEETEKNSRDIKRNDLEK